MGRILVHEFVSLDGVMEDPRWTFDYPFDPKMGQAIAGIMGQAKAILLGRTTYTMMHRYWSQVTDQDNIVAVKLNGQPKYVASTTLRDPEWQHTTVLSGDVIGQVRRLKQQPGGELQVHGSCGLARTLHQAGLIDEYRLLVFPVTVGRGKRLFPDEAPATGYTLTESRTTSRGAVYSVLQPAPFEAGRVPEPVGGSEAAGPGR